MVIVDDRLAREAGAPLRPGRGGPARAARADESDRQREAGQPTVPTRLGE